MSGETADHIGVDYAVPTGTPVKAAAQGTVVVAGAVSGYGNAVYVNHKMPLLLLLAGSERTKNEK